MHLRCFSPQRPRAQLADEMKNDEHAKTSLLGGDRFRGGSKFERRKGHAETEMGR